MKNTAKFAIEVLMVALSLTAAPCHAAWGDIKGGSTDDKHKDWSEVSVSSDGASMSLTDIASLIVSALDSLL
jgi:hypothetical protein